ncbi:hypothetical protein [Segniliparus rugosus]|uniref:Uncharacterized protein n=1 Tax=Segniliparus rugosus (strain ATCC BAA-974 / DSM 45345 / CCUG 50838 / CIP 108380 / JCM 13579 / CDC 945) TaxID=679197 RepID=E5XR52_SEGRC|nr:hypothetical protein [Segniliparus rugosus]EFV13145.1 hypothetical protein HMPREF9336_01974 [Segniliparus rugosus ATCC BAA-974]
MAYYGVGRYGREDVGAKTMRFDYMDRMAEDELDDIALGQQRAEAYKEGLPPIEPDQRINAKDGSEVLVYQGSKAHEVIERQKEAYKVSKGGVR